MPALLTEGAGGDIDTWVLAFGRADIDCRARPATPGGARGRIGSAPARYWHGLQSVWPARRFHKAPAFVSHRLRRIVQSLHNPRGPERDWPKRCAPQAGRLRAALRDLDAPAIAPLYRGITTAQSRLRAGRLPLTRQLWERRRDR